jgi:hypothetical protein
VWRFTQGQRRAESPADSATAATKTTGRCHARITADAHPQLISLISLAVKIVMEYLLSVAFSTHPTTMQAVCRACNSLQCFDSSDRGAFFTTAGSARMVQIANRQSKTFVSNSRRQGGPGTNLERQTLLIIGQMTARQ